MSHSKFLSLYKTIEYDDKRWPNGIEFPMDMMSLGVNAYSAYLPDHNNGSVRVYRPAGDDEFPTIVVPPYELTGLTEREVDCHLDQDAASCLVAAGTERNAVVFDKHAIKGIVTPRLVALLDRYMQSGARYEGIKTNGKSLVSAYRASRVTDILISDAAMIEAGALAVNPSIKWHVIDEVTWQVFIEDYYEDVLRGSHATQAKERLLIALDTTQHTFIHTVPKSHPTHMLSIHYDNGVEKSRSVHLHRGLCVLNNHTVLLGNY